MKTFQKIIATAILCCFLVSYGMMAQDTGAIEANTDDTPFISNVEITPNPLVGKAVVSFFIRDEVEVCAFLYNEDDMIIRKMCWGATKKGDNKVKVNLSWLSPGIYFMEVDSEKGAADKIRFERVADLPTL